jgi:hypothetical protein
MKTYTALVEMTCKAIVKIKEDLSSDKEIIDIIDIQDIDDFEVKDIRG